MLLGVNRGNSNYEKTDPSYSGCSHVGVEFLQQHAGGWSDLADDNYYHDSDASCYDTAACDGLR
jgi:hypothetical protein